MTWAEVANNHPICVTIVLLVAMLLLTQIVFVPFRIANRYIRHKNIVARGWPPEHLDADGDAIEKDDD